MRELNLQALEDILKGCTILGTGGGGSFERGYETVKRDIKNGKSFRLIELNEVPDEAYIAVPYYCGAIKPSDSTSEKERMSSSKESSALVAFRALENYLNKKFYAAISTELGGGNTATALSVAANQNIPAVDADPAGRSVPELVHSTFFVEGIPITPFAVGTETGDMVIVPKVADDDRAEAIARAIAVVSGGLAGVVDHPITGKRLKTSVIPGAISFAESLGKALRKAREANKNVIEAIINAGNGYLLFEGITKEDSNWEIKEGFTYGDILIAGSGKYQDNVFKIWFKNENLMSWLNEEIYVTAPDLICVLESTTGEPITNPNCKQGTPVSVIGFRAPDQWRTEKGLKVLSPAYFGFDATYVPIEEILPK